MSAAALRCPFHPDRDGVGICRECRRVVCADCATKLDGINHCRACLDAKLGRSRQGEGLLRRVFERVVAAAAIVLAFFALTGIYTWGALASADVSWFGTGYTETARALDGAASGLRRFKADVGRFPSEREGLRALMTDGPDPAAPPIAGWRGPYVRTKDLIDGDDLLDGYGMRLRYIPPAPARKGVGVLSLGLNHELDTDLDNLSDRDRATGDDRVEWVR